MGRSILCETQQPWTHCVSYTVCSTTLLLIPLHSHEALRKLYPKHSIVSSIDYRLNLFAFPAAQIAPLEHNPLITLVGFIPLNRSTSPVPGVLVDQVVTGAFTLTWQVSRTLFTSENQSLNTVFLGEEVPSICSSSELLSPTLF